MNIDWTNFTPVPALAGGVLIGVAAAMLVLFNGRIAGISGIIGGVLQRSRPPGEAGWRLAFLAGLLVAPLLAAAVTGLPDIRIDAGAGTLILAGLLVGLGTRYGSGCTSGHGVCGLSRFSPRSLAATMLFMAAGFVTVYVVRHLFGGLG
ncbi:MAG TPA: YeeE/YedE thiosulfate transporter family protein [Noviherbaspirillum sp.]|nr:YeeE/YedE thiosulfate transporter family protein [Noviherbaspirillum sp.]